MQTADVVTTFHNILTTPPWLLHRPEINYSLHSLHKDDTAPEIFRHNFNELVQTTNTALAFTPMDPKWEMEWPRQLFGKNRVNCSVTKQCKHLQSRTVCNQPGT